MPENGFHADDDWAAFTGAARKIRIHLFDPAQDTHGAAIPAKGSRDSRRVEVRGEQAITTTTWHIVKSAALASRPPLRSKILSCGEVWYITAVDGDPDDDSWICSCTLGK